MIRDTIAAIALLTATAATAAPYTYVGTGVALASADAHVYGISMDAMGAYLDASYGIGEYGYVRGDASLYSVDTTVLGYTDMTSALVSSVGVGMHYDTGATSLYVDEGAWISRYDGNRDTRGYITVGMSQGIGASVILGASYRAAHKADRARVEMDYYMAPDAQLTIRYDLYGLDLPSDTRSVQMGVRWLID